MSTTITMTLDSHRHPLLAEIEVKIMGLLVEYAQISAELDLQAVEAASMEAVSKQIHAEAASIEEKEAMAMAMSTVLIDEKKRESEVTPTDIKESSLTGAIKLTSALLAKGEKEKVRVKAALMLVGAKKVSEITDDMIPVYIGALIQ